MPVGRLRPVAGRVVAVTGGARGIGAAVATVLARLGARVAIGDRDTAAAQALARRLGGAVLALPLDVTSTASYRRFLDTVEQRLGPLEVLVNNAGVMWVGPFEEEPDEAVERQFAVNTLGVIRGTRLAAPRMQAAGGGHLVTIASAASRISPRGQASYAATKHAVYGYLSAVRAELRGTGVDVSVVMPTVVRTELARGTGHGVVPLLESEHVARAVLSALVRPRFEVFVPGYVGGLVRLLALLPQPLRDLATRFALPNQLVEADRAARRDYERAALFTDPSVPPA